MALEPSTSRGFSVAGSDKEGIIYDYSQPPGSAELVFLVWATLGTLTSILVPNAPNFYIMATDSSIAVKVSSINLTIQD